MFLVSGRTIDVVEDEALFLGARDNPRFLPSAILLGSLENRANALVAKVTSPIPWGQQNADPPMHAPVLINLFLPGLDIDGARVPKDQTPLGTASHAPGHGISASRILKSPDMDIGGRRSGVKVMDRIEIPGSDIKGTSDTKIYPRPSMRNRSRNLCPLFRGRRGAVGLVRGASG